MGCFTCGQGDQWIKTCRWRHSGEVVRVCDPCYETLREVVWIIPGPEIVAGRCDGCGGYFNPREISELRPAARKDCYGGLCITCTGMRQ